MCIRDRHYYDNRFNRDNKTAEKRWHAPRKEIHNAAVSIDNPINKGDFAAACQIVEDDECVDVSKMVKDGMLHVNGKSIPVMSMSCQDDPVISMSCQDDSNVRHSLMPITNGSINGVDVSVLRDTGCSGVIVRKKFVKIHQFTGKIRKMLLIDNTLRTAPEARIWIRTPFYTGYVEALCLNDALYDLTLGNIPGALGPETIGYANDDKINTDKDTSIVKVVYEAEKATKKNNDKIDVGNDTSVAEKNHATETATKDSKT